MENQVYEPEAHREAVQEESDARRLSTADLVVSAERITSAGPSNGDQSEAGPLFETNEAQRFRSQWQQIQIGFVDEPRKSVEQADELVATVIKRLAEVFAEERNRLEREWDRDSGASTEDFRLAIRKYRSFFDRLLSV